MRRISVLILCFLWIVPISGQDDAPSDPLYPYTIDGLRERDTIGGEIQTRYIMSQENAFTQYYIDYTSDDLTITGVMNIPTGEGPFPVVILLHGYYNRDTYWSGMGTWQSASYFASNGYLTISPDFRTWGESDDGLNLFATGLTIDTLNLISAVESLPQADTEHIFLWGHSMGGGVATKALVVDERISGAVLYAPNSANDADLIARWGPACLLGQSESAGDKCNPADVLPPDTPIDLQTAYSTTAFASEAMQTIAPIYHLENITAPLQIHIGTADGAQLAQTPPEWSETLYLALVDAERNVSYFVYPNEGHFFDGEAWVQMMQRAVNFFNSLQ